MADVKNVGLSIINANAPNQKKVTVSYTLQFDPAEAGKQFQVVIRLWGEDLPGDEEQPPDDLRYTFMFGLKSYTSVVAQAGSMNFHQTRDVITGTLNEDPGFREIPVAPDTTIKIPHGDEVYATVTLSQLSTTARSSTVKMLL
ncbi:hypothetical protein [Hyalangium versicolor]|uniref:hypothetical protein n=1 Tax=Hyalangium versicolor TaxID=2861190 RepID=UPI001CCA28DF|nr:hypothetical protein [Hyalangium versicolor]